jgi:hypothetical protein
MANASLQHVVLTGFLTAMLSALTTAACSDSGSPVDDQKPSSGASPAKAESGPATKVNRFASWAGRWNGVEGMYVDIKALGGGQYQLEMQHNLDEAATYMGQDDEHGIRFVRKGVPLMLYPTSGDEIGLKYLAGKKDCLIVKQYEGYCRD